MANLETATIRTQVRSVTFGMYDTVVANNGEKPGNSILEITSATSFDNLGNPLPGGLYDPRLGPTRQEEGSCVTCGQSYSDCMGHQGHITLPLILYHPLTFKLLIKLLRAKCLNCHMLRVSEVECKVFETQCLLIKAGSLARAVQLREEIDGIRSRAKMEAKGSAKGTTETAALGVEHANTKALEFLRELVQNLNQSEVKHKLTNHERGAHRAILKEFQALIGNQKTCKHCGCTSNNVRSDGDNKVFLVPLSAKTKKQNAAVRVGAHFKSAILVAEACNSHKINVNELAGQKLPKKVYMSGHNGGGYGSDDEDMDYHDVNDDTNDDDDEIVDGEGVKSKTQQQDKFLNPLEVYAQVRLTWCLQPFLCSQLYGSAQDKKSVPTEEEKGFHIFFMNHVLVAPARFRPPMVMGNMTVEHSQNVQLIKVMELCDLIREAQEKISGLSGHANPDAASDAASQVDDGSESSKPDSGVEDERELHERLNRQLVSYWMRMQENVNHYMTGTSDGKVVGIRQLLEKKEGIFRKHMMGKRVNFACRSVISPDPYIGTNEIGLPLKFAKTLTYPTPVTSLNIKEMRSLVMNGPTYPGALWVDEIMNNVGSRASNNNSGRNKRRYMLQKMTDVQREAMAARLTAGTMIVGRQLRNGDFVLMNRQPTLHKPGIMAHRVRVLYSPTQQTIRMHYANCNTYNADYDGDEMNCHFPQNELGRAECQEIVSTDLQYIVPTDGTPLRGLIQDHVDAGVKLTSPNTFLRKHEYQQLIYAACAGALSGLGIISENEEIIMVPPTISKPVELWTGKQVITTLLQHLRRKTEFGKVFILPGISVDRKAKTPPDSFGKENQALGGDHLVLIREGELLRGVLDKAAFGATDFSLVHAVQEAYGAVEAGLLLNAFGRLFSTYLQYYSGHSCRMEDLILKDHANKERRNLVQRSYNIGSRAAKAWADSDGGKTEIVDVTKNKEADKPLSLMERTATAAKIGDLLSGTEGGQNAALLDSYMQGIVNPLASSIIKACLPHGLEVPFPENTFGLMVTTGAKGSKVNQSQVSCALGQQALEGRRVPRMLSGKTLPAFEAYDPNPRADGFIADRFLTGVRPQEYYFHCMAGREGLVDTAVKTARSGYLQRCLVKHLEELMVNYDSTVRDSEGSVIQFVYGEDGIDPTKAAHLDCSDSNLKYMALNYGSLKKKYSALPNATINTALSVANQANVNLGANAKIRKGSFVQAKKLRFGSNWKRGTLCRGWFDATIKSVHSDGTLDVYYHDDQSTVKRMPPKINLDGAGGRSTRADCNLCELVRLAAPDPALSKSTPLGRDGASVSEAVALKASKAASNSGDIKNIIQASGFTRSQFEDLIAAKYGSALCAPGEAVGSVAAQGVGEPSTQMTLNTFHLAGAGANVTLGIPRLREIIMTASRELKTPTMSVPLLDSISEKEGKRLATGFTRLTLKELLASRKGITVTEKLQKGEGGWDRAYYITLRLHPAERIKEAFGISLEDIATVAAKSFLSVLSQIMKKELKRIDGEIGSLHIEGAHTSDFNEEENEAFRSYNEEQENDKAKKKKKQKDEYDDEVAGEEDGVMGSRFGHRKEMTSYGDMDDEEKELSKQAEDDDQYKLNTAIHTVTDDEDDAPAEFIEMKTTSNNVQLDYRRNAISLNPLKMNPAAPSLLMVGLIERAAETTVVTEIPKIERAFLNHEEGRGKCLQTAGINFSEIWKLAEVDHNQLKSNDIWATRCTYGVEAARMSIVEQIRGVFGVYGISVDPRHLSLIADYMTFDGGFKAMNRIRMVDDSSTFLQMSFETTATFLTEAALRMNKEDLISPSANIVMGRPMAHGTGCFDCLVKY